MRLKRCTMVTLVSVFLVIGSIFVVFPVLAKSDNPFFLESSNPAEGQNDFLISSEIKLTFNKNIVNMNVKENNLKCFAMSDENGNNIPINVVMADDQIDREKRQDVILIPQQELKQNTKYIVKISSNLQSKSGDVLEKEIELSFSTEKGKKPFKLVGTIAILVLLSGVYFNRKRIKKAKTN